MRLSSLVLARHSSLIDHYNSKSKLSYLSPPIATVVGDVVTERLRFRGLPLETAGINCNGVPRHSIAKT